MFKRNNSIWPAKAVAPLLRSLLRDRDGAIAVWFALGLLIFIPVMALAIDLPFAMVERNRLQVAASSGALAGAATLVDADKNGTPDNDDYRTEAVAFAYKNLSVAGHGEILDTTCGTYDPGTGQVVGGGACPDVVPGNWNPANTPKFDPVPTALPLNAVQVSARRSTANDNPITTFLAGAVGVTSMNVNTSAIAWNDSSTLDCFQSGIMAGGLVTFDSNNTLIDDICVYGELGVRVQTSDCFQGPNEGCGQGTQDPGVQVKTPDASDFEEQGGPNPGFQDAQVVGTETLELATQTVDFIDAVEAGFPPGAPIWSVDGFDFDAFANPNITTTSTTWPILTEVPVSGTLYDLPGQTVTIKDDGTVHQDFAIRAKKIVVADGAEISHSILLATDEIDVKGLPNATAVTNTVLASRNLLKIGSDAEMGGIACDPSGINVAVYAQGLVDIGSSTKISNTHFVSSYVLSTPAINVQTDSIFKGVTIQALGQIDFGSNNDLTSCPPGTGEGPTGNGLGPVVRLVD